MLLWFPNGAVPGRRWRAAAVLPALAGTATLALVGLSWPYRGPRLLPDAPTPDGAAAAGLVAVLDAAALVILAGVAVGLASLVRRLRAGDAVIRQQVKWYLYSGAATVVLNLLNDTVLPGLGLGMLGLLVSEAGILIAIERFGLWDVDRLINRTLVYGTLTVIAVGAYVGCALGLAVVFTGVGHGGDLAVAGATLAAAALVTPARRAVQSAIDRAFDRRAFDAVALVRSHAERIGAESARPDEPRGVLAQALRDPELRLVFRLSDGRVVDPFGAAADAPLGRPAAGHGRAADARVVEPLAVRGAQVGWLEHRPIPPHETRLFRAVLDAAGPVLAHGRLQAELRVHLAAVQASRTRIVAAADAERRRIERDLHDGAQQRLVALAARLRLEQRRRGQAVDPATSTLMEGTITELRQALEELRALAQGLLPAALASEGLGPALGELVDRQPGEARLVAVPGHRHWSGLEATAWFVAAEGLANAAKHAAGTPVIVRASCQDGLLTVAVVDGGPGGARIGAGTGLRGLADRVEALGGRLLVEDRPGGGTDLRAALPCSQVPSAELGGTDYHEGEGVSPARSAPRAVTG
jgi:signal transduction histidine kinase